ncbi:MAG: VCBS repeat-containing protein [Chitinophagales bacterium]|nr:VCBS repeat-containing protein [Chitinophagales bacterium]
MKHWMGISWGMLAFGCTTLLAVTLSSCNSGYKNADLTAIDFPGYDSTKFDPIDKSTGKLFDILSNQATGLNFINKVQYHIGDDNNQYNYYYNGAGVAVLNVNGDSLPDLYFTANLVPDRLYINEGNMHFKDVSAPAGILQRNKGWSTGVSIVDINNDGLDDIYVCRSRWKDSLANLLYVNNGDNTFSEKAAQYGIDSKESFHIMANFFDYDKDGDMDLFLACHPTDWVDKMRFNNFEKVGTGQNQSDKLYRNDGGHFIDVSKEAGINTQGYSLSCTSGDLNGDGYPDIYVPNDFAMYDLYFVNQKNGTFKESTKDYIKKTSLFGMGSDIGDINNDGYLDIMVADMKFDHSYVRRSFMLSQRRAEFNNMVAGGYYYQYVKNSLQLNNGNGYFSEIAELAGVDATEWSWSPLLVDLDNDGYQDIFMSNGYYKTFNIDERELYQAMKDATRRKDTATYNKMQRIINHKKLRDPNCVFKNNGDLTFTRETNNWGFFEPTISHGAAFADFDKDGDIDIVVSNTDQTSLVYRNNESQMLKNHFIQFKFSGSEKNTKGIGTEVKIYTKNGMQFQSYHVVRGYQSCSENFMHFGLGDATSVDKVYIKWPDGRQQELDNLEADHVYTVSYKDALEKNLEPQDQSAPMFSDVTNKLKIDFVHQEDEYNDFQKELLLPQKNSHYGPGLAAGDVNDDGLDDFFVCGAMRQTGVLYLQTANGEFQASGGQPWENDKAADGLGTLLFDADGDEDLDLFVVSGGNEMAANDKAYADHFYINDGKGRFSEASNDALPALNESGSCIVAGDYDDDGDLDLFIGGRLVPQQYPSPAKSTILQNNHGKFTDVTAQIAPELNKEGLVCSAIWTDFNNDNKLDLILTGEWMPVTFLENENGKFVNITKQIGFENTTGLWNSIVSGDFDNDGDMDYIAANEGWNTRYYRPSPEYPIDLYANDFDKNGTQDVVISFYNFGKSYPVKNLQYSAEQMPMLAKEFKTYSGFALSTTEEIYGPKGLDKAYHMSAKTLASSFIENKGNGKFELRALPIRAQASSIYGMMAYDVNRDGYLDLVYQGNFFSKETETERNDAFIGEVLLGDGAGNFNYLPSVKSGFFNNQDAKALSMIYIGKNKAPVMLCTNNNDKMLAFSLDDHGTEKIPYTDKDKYIEVILNDGHTQRHETNFGGGYLSQNANVISFIPGLTSKVVITDYKNQERTVFSSGTLAAK